jgi:hypothetical protein
VPTASAHIGRLCGVYMASRSKNQAYDLIFSFSQLFCFTMKMDWQRKLSNFRNIADFILPYGTHPPKSVHWTWSATGQRFILVDAKILGNCFGDEDSFLPLKNLLAGINIFPTYVSYLPNLVSMIAPKAHAHIMSPFYNIYELYVVIRTW